MRRIWSGFSREYKLLILAWFFIGITGGIYDTVFNNYLNEVFHVSAQVRGFLEFPREAPGFFIALLSGLLMFMADVRLLGVAVGLVSLGLLGQSFYIWQGEPQFGWMIGSMILWSIGMHLFLPLSSSVSVKLADRGKVGQTLGLMNGVNTASVIIGCLLIWVVMGWLKAGYSWAFRAAALFGLVGMVCVFAMRVKDKAVVKGVKVRLLWRKEYSLFYWLSILFGARKQVFMTFAPWVIVQVYHQEPRVMAALILTSAVIGIGFKPLVGWLIDRIGERKVLIGEAIWFFLICLGYAGADHLGLGKQAINVVFVCFIIDLLLSSVSMARTTYLHKNLVETADLTPTLSMGISLDHAVAMTIPILGGLLWKGFGYESLFLVAGLISVANIFIALKIKLQEKTIIRQD